MGSWDENTRRFAQIFGFPPSFSINSEGGSDELGKARQVVDHWRKLAQAVCAGRASRNELRDAVAIGAICQVIPQAWNGSFDTMIDEYVDKFLKDAETPVEEWLG